MSFTIKPGFYYEIILPRDEMREFKEFLRKEMLAPLVKGYDVLSQDQPGSAVFAATFPRASARKIKAWLVNNAKKKTEVALSI